MRRVMLCALSVFALCLLYSTVVLAGGRDADYPLRVHIFSFNSHSHYSYGTVNFRGWRGSCESL
jgi:hypothetical protein